MGNGLFSRRSCIVKIHLCLVDGNAKSQGLFDCQCLACSGRGTCSIPFRQVVCRTEEDHIVRACQHDVLPPLRRGQREIDQRPLTGLLRDDSLILEMNLDFFRTMMTERRDPFLLPQSYMYGNGVPCAIRSTLSPSQLLLLERASQCLRMGMP